MLPNYVKQQAMEDVIFAVSRELLEATSGAVALELAQFPPSLSAPRKTHINLVPGLESDYPTSLNVCQVFPLSSPFDYPLLLQLSALRTDLGAADLRKLFSLDWVGDESSERLSRTVCSPNDLKNTLIALLNTVWLTVAVGEML